MCVCMYAEFRHALAAQARNIAALLPSLWAWRKFSCIASLESYPHMVLIHTHTYIHTYIYIHFLTYIRLHKCMCSDYSYAFVQSLFLASSLYAYIHTYVHAHIWSLTCSAAGLSLADVVIEKQEPFNSSDIQQVRTYVRIHTYIHAHTYIFTYRCVCMCVRMCFRRVSRWPWSGWHLWNALPATSCTPP